MAQVPEQVLAWLYKVLHDYQDPQRTYSDAARTLSTHPTLSPRTEILTTDTGASALLLVLTGTLPVTFRGTIYRFPLKVWLPKQYPHAPPIVYITPGAKDTMMAIRPGQHVGTDGRVYHPYLRDWGAMWDRASLGELLGFLAQSFAREPPVVRQVGAEGQIRQGQVGGSGDMPPQLPPKQRAGSAGRDTSVSAPNERPPPRPPKPGEESAQQQQGARDVNVDGPPLPPLPHEMQGRPQPAPPVPQRQDTYRSVPSHQSQPLPSTSQLHPYENGRPPGGAPLQQDQQHQQQQRHMGPQPLISQQRTNFDRSPVSPISPMNGYTELPPQESTYGQLHPPPVNGQGQYAPSQLQDLGSRGQYLPQQQQQPYQSIPQQQQQQYPNNQPYQPNPPPPPQQLQSQTQPKQPPPDLLTDPFDLTLPNPTTTSLNHPSLPAPPIPPNPEKEHLLHALSQTLTTQLTHKTHQTLSALQPLQTQSQALTHATQTLEAELQHLTHLEATITQNERILHRSMQACDAVISEAKTKPLPAMDDVLIAPTVVGNQLWRLCAEEAACREAMYVLQKGVDRGRVSGGDFVRQMRGLGREGFLRMVLARKCARGLGLEEVGR